MSDSELVLPCVDCGHSVYFPSYSWMANCMNCGKIVAEPIKSGFQYVVVDCTVMGVYREPICVKEGRYKCCSTTHVITNETVLLYGQLFKKAVKLTPEMHRELQLKEKLEKLTNEKEKAEREVEHLRKEMEKIISQDEERMVECDKCHKRKIMDGWLEYCECSAMLLKKLDKGYRYVSNGCPSKVFRLRSDWNSFTCQCCYREHIVGNLLPGKVCGQEVYSSEMSVSIISKQELRIKELTEALEKEKKTVDEAEEATKFVEEMFGLQIDELKKDLEIKNVEVETAKMNEAAMAKKCEEMIANLLSQIKEQQNNSISKDTLAQIEFRAEEAEKNFLKEKTELINKMAEYKKELTDVKAECNSLAESNADVWEKLAETEEKCRDLVTQNENMRNINNNLMEINVMVLKKINEIAEYGFESDCKKEEKIQAVIDMQTARM